VTTHNLKANQVHYTWSSRHEPRLKIDPGDRVQLTTRDGFDGQLEGLASSDLDTTLDALDFARIAPLTGPVFVEGARPGDVAVVKIRRLSPVGTGWTVVWPEWCGFDYARPTELPKEGRIVRFAAGRLIAGSYVEVDGARVLVRPMLGMLGTAPAVGEFATLPPRTFGGNMDLRHVAEGATIYLPVFVDGALISFGDGHAAQGDGEVCTTGIECGMDVEVSISIERGRQIDEPEVETADAYMVTAFGRDLDSAARAAINYMHRHLTEVRGMSASDAYVLMGLAGHLSVNQVVNTPHIGTRFSIPLEALDR
jgi:acetamidase/formamidase